MKNSKKIILVLACVVLFALGVIGGYVGYQLTYHPSKYLVPGDDAVEPMDFETAINSLSFMHNTWQEALPQTEVYKILRTHFESPLPAGKTQKKAIVIGYDGCRVDNFRLLATSERSAINTLLSMGGEAIFTYAGGVPYPHANTQATSTAPGWCSMLTGVLADVHGITNNGQPKAVEPKTLLLSLVEDGLADASAFYVSWNGHFSRKNATYVNEVKYAKENDVNATFRRAYFDNGTRRNILNDLAQDDCTDFIFSTLEYTDHAGHASGFTPENIKYVSGFRNAEATGCDIIEAIENRPTYDAEDWLILITTDHGGNGKKHGGPSFEERMTFIVSNKPITA